MHESGIKPEINEWMDRSAMPNGVTKRKMREKDENENEANGK